MLLDIPNLAIIEGNFYRNNSLFRYFINLTEKDKKRIRKLSYKLKRDSFSNNKLNNYLVTMQFLTSPRARITMNEEYAEKYNLYFKNYDEAIYFLIYVLDPKLEIFKIYSENRSNYREIIRRAKGFYNDYIVNYEKDYISKFSKKLVSNTNTNHLKTLATICSMTQSFLITQERFDEIKKIAENWSNNFNGNSKIDTCIFNAFNQKSLLGLKNEKESIVFIILHNRHSIFLTQIYFLIHFFLHFFSNFLFL